MNNDIIIISSIINSVDIRPTDDKRTFDFYNTHINECQELIYTLDSLGLFEVLIRLSEIGLKLIKDYINIPKFNYIDDRSINNTLKILYNRYILS